MGLGDLVTRIRLERQAGTERRSITGVSWAPWLSPAFGYRDSFAIGGPAHPARAATEDGMYSLAAVYGCVRTIADAVASLPVRVYRRLPDGTSERVASSQLLDSPSADLAITQYDWFFEAQTSALMHGNALGLISSRTGFQSPNGLGYPQTIEWLPMEQVDIVDDPTQPWNPMRAKFYLNGALIDRNELVHLRSFKVPGRTAGISPMRVFHTLWSQGLDALKYSADWFANGGIPPGTFQNVAEEVAEEDAKQIRKRLTDSIRLRQPLVYGRDWDFKPIIVPPSESQFVQAMQLNATQIATIYGVPPTMVGGTKGDSMTYSSVEMDVLWFITHTLRPWLRRWEQLLSSLLPASQYVTFDTDALLKTDLKTRTEIYQMQRRVGLKTTDEIRKEMDLPPMPRGAGASAISLESEIGMSRGTAAVPKAIADELVPFKAAPGQDQGAA